MSVTGTIGAIGAIGGGIASAVGSSAAAGAQADAANNAANLQRQNATDALNFQKQVYSNQQQNIAPWLASGKGALSNLDYLMGITPQSAATSSPSNSGTGSGSINDIINSIRAQNGAGSGTGVTPGGNRLMPFSANTPMLQPEQNQFSPSARQAGAAGMLGANGQPQAEPPPPSINNLSGNLGDPSPFPNGLGNLGGPTTASTNQGGTGTVARTDGGDQSGAGAVPGGAFGSLAQGFNEKFAAPTNVTEQNDPGYQFRLNQGDKAIQNSAAARGGLLSGGTAKALSDYNQNSASGEYGNVYNRALTEYQQRYNIFNNNQSTLFNRLADLSGFGQTAAGQLNSAGTAAANNNTNTLLTSGQQIGQQINNAGAANASGYVGVGNAVSGGLNNLASIYALLRSQGGGGSDPSAGMGVF